MRVSGQWSVVSGRWSVVRGRSVWRAVLAGVLLLWAQAVWGADFDLIVCGSGGEVDYTAQFRAWGMRLRDALVDRLGHPAGRVTLLTESGEDADGVSTLAEVRAAVHRLAGQVTARDDLFVYLIGHGTYRQQTAKLNLPGSDLSAGELDRLLKAVAARRLVVIQAAPASAAFVNVLSGPGRILCTSTRSADERNATRFMEYFVQALEDGSADTDRDERISVLEACRQASALTQAWYTGEGYVATEHALLDDNGDGLGTRLAEMDSVGADGKEAARCFVMDYRAPAGTPPEQVDAYRAAMDEVQALIAQKAEMDSAAYFGELESRLVRAARLNREIRSQE